MNPHCESILKFNEDDKIVLAAINSAKKKGYKVKGPFSADTIFLKNNRKKLPLIRNMPRSPNNCISQRDTHI